MIKLEPAHTIKSRDVVESDIERIVKDAPIMRAICNMPSGIYSHGFAVAHSQVTKEDPLRFFVTKEGLVVINPIIERHSSTSYIRNEGCLTYPTVPLKKMDRWYKCEVSFNVLEGNKISERKQRSVKAIEAQVFQHELNHMDAIYIYDEKDLAPPAPPISAGDSAGNP